MKGIVLEQGTVVTLASNGTLVYVEEVLPAFVEVVALPDQPDTREDERVFHPGAVRAKKISPFSSPETTHPIESLTEDNQTFITELDTLRSEHGLKYISGEKNRMTVRKETGSGRERKPRPVKCSECGELEEHANHPDVHDFAAKAPRKKREPRAEKPTGPYVLGRLDLTEVQAASDKFKPGNRFHRVFLALQSLPDSTGTLDQIIVAVVTDGARMMTDPEKVVRRALKQLIDAGNVIQGEQTANTEPESTTEDADD